MTTFLPSENSHVIRLIPSLTNRPDVVALCRRYAVRSLFLYGSTARGEARSDSDIDLLVSFSQRVSLLHMVALERELSELLGHQVDLQTEAALSPDIRARILKERQQVYAA